MNTLEIAYLHTLWLSSAELRRILDPTSLLSTTSYIPSENPEYFFTWVGRKFPKTTLSYESFILELQKKDVQIVCEGDDLYPESLGHIGTPPLLLYVRWDLRLDIPKIAIVGSRESTPYGESIVQSFIPSLVGAGYSIVSGGALGIDSEAHRVALEHLGHTIAVVGSWVDIAYPARHRGLYDQILSHGGAIVSQFPIGTESRPYMFPMRNELIAGLSIGVMVVEAREKSGSLITARLALEQGKDVFIPPSDIGRQNSWGTLRFLQWWAAKLVLGPEDILIEYGHSSHSTSWPSSLEKIPFDTTDLSPREISILTLLSTASDPDTIAESLGLDISETLGTLSTLEIYARVQRRSDGTYERIS